jgi:hypothetical protein
VVSFQDAAKIQGYAPVVPENVDDAEVAPDIARADALTRAGHRGKL